MKYLLLVCLEEPPDPPLETAEEIASWDVQGDDIKPWLSEVAAKHPVARFGMIEVRPFRPLARG